MNKERFVFVCLFALSLALFLAPIPPSPLEGRGLDKLVHFMIFAALLLSGFAAFQRNRTALLSGLLVYGPLIEILQFTLFTYRSFAYRDIAFDFGGLAIGYLIFKLSNSRFKEI